ncbi:hypothetical protein [Pontibacterium sp.]|uniref:hypothetical protein n=1 Tax=Pontibacterium sp. TaxID=2036026 RepID=UPI0035663176
MLIRLICLAFAAVAVVGCSTGNITPELSASTQRDVGVAVLALTKSGGDPWQVAYRYEQIDGDVTGLLEMKADQDGTIHSDYNSVQGNLTFVELPAGDYRITGWQLRRWLTTRESSVPLDIRFRVYPGRFTYAGELNLDTADQRILEAGVTAVVVQVKGAAERDIQHIQQYHPQVDFLRFRMHQMRISIPSGLAR